MIKYVIFVMAFFVEFAVAAPLSAVMTFESMTITSEGVRKQTQFQEKFIRDNNTIWSERIIPTSTKQHAHSDHEGHGHDLNFATAAKWIVKDAASQIKFRFVRINDKKIIEPRVTEYETLGFNGDWESAYFLLNRDVLKKMIVLKQQSPNGSTWYEKKNAQEFTRILWDETHQIPLSIETGRLDGTMDNKITIAINSAPKTLPWNQIAQYQTIAYEDLLD